MRDCSWCATPLTYICTALNSPVISIRFVICDDAWVSAMPPPHTANALDSPGFGDILILTGSVGFRYLKHIWFSSPRPEKSIMCNAHNTHNLNSHSFRFRCCFWTLQQMARLSASTTQTALPSATYHPTPHPIIRIHKIQVEDVHLLYIPCFWKRVVEDSQICPSTAVKGAEPNAASQQPPRVCPELTK